MKNKIIIFSDTGLSAESGILTFRDTKGKKNLKQFRKIKLYK